MMIMIMRLTLIFLYCRMAINLLMWDWILITAQSFFS